MTTTQIVGSLITAYALGWAWAYSVLMFKRFMEIST